MKKDASYWIKALKLQTHPEGGFYKETYRSREVIPKTGLPARYNKERCFFTSIYYLLRSRDKSCLHRLKSEEIWHFFAGRSLTISMISPAGELQRVKLGRNLEKKETLQVVVPANHWFGATVDHKSSYTLIGCTVAPGFDFEDFELAKKEQLRKEYPELQKIIETLT
ncbi:MAG: cupin domain-containing protein [Candidatus Margulisbacteria bacterium]|nr:cupin domain-containing protein [Candidatus Margulisiibacteriota bacterium]